MKLTKQGWNAFRQYKTGDLSQVWLDLREEDLLELSGAALEKPEEVERLTLEGRAKMLTWDTDEGPVAVLGVTPSDEPDVGLVWAVASSRAKPRWRFAVRNTEGVLREIAGNHSVLSNFKDARNKQQIEWLKKVGFTFIQHHEGKNGLTYFEFVRIMK